MYLRFLFHKLWNSHADSTRNIFLTKWPIKLHDYLPRGLVCLACLHLTCILLAGLIILFSRFDSCTQLGVFFQKCQNFSDFLYVFLYFCSVSLLLCLFLNSCCSFFGKMYTLPSCSRISPDWTTKFWDLD